MNDPIAINGDPAYTEHVSQDFLNKLRWSRKRRKKWLRRNGLRLTANPHWDESEMDGPDICWCGVRKPYYAPVGGNCGGLGMLNCYCGGDQCVCHNHGEVDCLGCPDCDDDDNDLWADQEGD